MPASLGTLWRGLVAKYAVSTLLQGGPILQQSIKQVVVQALYLEDESAPTGTCATAIMNNERSLVANLAAANNYKVSRCE